jgi:hypothetical protein
MAMVFSGFRHFKHWWLRPKNQAPNVILGLLILNP